MGRRGNSSNSASSNNTSKSKMITRSASAAAANIVSASSQVTSQGESSTNNETRNRSRDVDRPEPCISPAKCAICLGDLTNRCYTNSCIHQFCFPCLREWSKVKPECPLCKSTFSSIYHNIRSIDDYDEYHIPSPPGMIPHLSIRLTPDPFSYRQSSHRRFSEANLHFHTMMNTPSPFHDHGYSFQRLVRERERNERIANQNSYIRILEVGPVSEPSVLDFVSLSNTATGSGSSQVFDNPFYEDDSELFGSFEENDRATSSDPSLRGYQNRKRIYDRAQYVQPYAGTLPGLYPSVEYFRNNPTAINRSSAWLYREIMVLMGIHRSRTDMGYVYDVILGLLLRYDIRSREFREMLSIYFGTRTRHFQHEFYHFILSGMAIEDYDRAARYATATISSSTATRSTATPTPVPTTSTSSQTQRPSSPIIVTISDTESEDEAVTRPQVASGSQRNSAREISQPSAPIARARRTIPRHPPNVDPNGNYTPIFCPPPAHENSRYLHRGRNRHDEQPHSSNSRLSNWLRDLIEPQPPLAHSNNQHQSVTGSYLLDEWEGPYNSLPRFPPLGPDVDGNGLNNPIDNYRYASRMHSSVSNGPTHPSWGCSSWRPDRPTRPIDSTSTNPVIILDDMENRPRRHNVAGINEDIFCRDNLERSHHDNHCCHHHPSSSNSSHRHIGVVEVPLRRTVIFSRTVPDVNEQINKSSTGKVEQLSPVALVTALQGTSTIGSATVEDDDDIQMLGVHPIVKPPPLAIITLSSDDEEDNSNAQQQKLSKLPTSPNVTDDFDDWDFIFSSDVNEILDEPRPSTSRAIPTMSRSSKRTLLPRIKRKKRLKISPAYVRSSDESSLSDCHEERGTEEIICRRIKPKKKRSHRRSNSPAAKKRRKHHKTKRMGRKHGSSGEWKKSKLKSAKERSTEPEKVDEILSDGGSSTDFILEESMDSFKGYQSSSVIRFPCLEDEQPSTSVSVNMPGLHKLIESKNCTTRHRNRIPKPELPWKLDTWDDTFQRRWESNDEDINVATLNQLSSEHELDPESSNDSSTTFDIHTSQMNVNPVLDTEPNHCVAETFPTGLNENIAFMELMRPWTGPISAIPYSGGLDLSIGSINSPILESLVDELASHDIEDGAQGNVYWPNSEPDSP